VFGGGGGVDVWLRGEDRSRACNAVVSPLVVCQSIPPTIKYVLHKAQLVMHSWFMVHGSDHYNDPCAN